MVWRPRLVLRRGKGGGISSPTSSAGYAVYGVMAGVGTVACVAGALYGKPLMLLGVAITGVFLRDVWAWFAASEHERADFRAEIGRLGGGPDQLIIGQSRGARTLIATWLVVSIAAIWMTRRVEWLVSVLFAASFAVAVSLDVLRGHFRGSERLRSEPPSPKLRQNARKGLGRG